MEKYKGNKVCDTCKYFNELMDKCLYDRQHYKLETVRQFFNCKYWKRSCNNVPLKIQELYKNPLLL